MPHFIVEYTDNLNEDLDLHRFLQQVNETIIAQGCFPTGGIRSRAIKLEDYVVADGSCEDDTFIHAKLKIGQGRSEAEKQKVSDEIFALMTDYFADVFAKHPFALSFELEEFQRTTYKKNNIHARYK
ncbi:5-carboxymethyl-2-hydroxymuconate delta isomerase [Salsuginibacillus halophilus]|uniref:5-carboxymethyl-2-hydroxymuconate delta isomerase n=1 Tax=Salsuginibacillus halophilus TaxID=517424 RepID=A0A2P8HQH4_9BACI|nr:5-carboxymethyl-2-hydroxymuconate Delta-isomerase [Salsuginibacillus halophilus]PSL48466.1 5-carboxymethyl-2-hydroxymuconate delta isomerase [Salsuginibacillus halophilus]